MAMQTISTKKNRVYQRRFDHEIARRLHAQGRSYSELAQMFDVSPTAIARVCDDEQRAKVDARSKAWMRENKRMPCLGGCGALVWMMNGIRTGYCQACLAALKTAADERDGELRCTKCGTWKPDEEFRAQRRATRRGRDSRCRDCENATRRDYRHRHRVAENASQRRQKAKTRGKEWSEAMTTYTVLKQATGNGDGTWHEVDQVEASSPAQAVERCAQEEGTYVAFASSGIVDIRVQTVFKAISRRSRAAA